MSLWAFLQDRRAGVAPIFALAIIPVIGLVGAAVDYSRANSVRTTLQAALDATALAMAKSAQSLTEAQLLEKSNAHFHALFNRPEAKNVTLAAAYTSSGGSTLTLTASGAIDTTFTRIMGYTQLNVGSSATIKWGNQRLRVALALDTTGSMQSAGKIDALKTATKNLLDQLRDAATNTGDVYVSIIPFSKDVNTGSTNSGATWLDWTEWEDEPPFIKTNKPSNWADIGPGSSCPFSNGNHGFRCTQSPVNGSSNASNIPSSGTYKGYICPSIDNGSKISSKASVYYNGCYDSQPTTTTTEETVCTGTWCGCGSLTNCSCTGSGSSKVCKQTVTSTGAPYTHNWIKNARSTWTGCVTDRGTAAGPAAENYDQKVTTPTDGVPASQFAAEQFSNCSPEMMALNYNWTAMKSLVDSLYPAGTTNQPIGLVWGWQSLVGGGPFGPAPAKDANYTYKEVIILLSDGLNTKNRWNGNGSSQSAEVDARMYGTGGVGTCKNIKDAGITIYAIHVNTDGDPLSTLLQNCASDSGKFVMLTSASQMITTFQQIGTQLSQLRIAK
jgi:Flp pilus assembly protein TadG